MTLPLANGRLRGASLLLAGSDLGYCLDLREFALVCGSHGKIVMSLLEAIRLRIQLLHFGQDSLEILGWPT